MSWWPRLVRGCPGRSDRPDRTARRLGGGQLQLSSLTETCRPGGAAPLVSERPICHPVAPRDRIVGDSHLFESPPGHQKGARHQIVGIPWVECSPLVWSEIRSSCGSECLSISGMPSARFHHCAVHPPSTR